MPDKTTIDQLIAEATALLSSEPKRTIALGEEALGVAESLGDSEQLARTHIFVGSTNRFCGDSARAREHLQQGFEIAFAHQHTFWIAEASLQLGILDLHQEEFDRAKSRLKVAAELFESLKKTRSFAKALFNLGNIAILQKQYAETTRYLSKCLLLYEEDGYEQGMAEVLGTLGAVAMEEKRYRSALESFDKALLILRSIGDKRNLIAISFNIADCFSRLGNLETAEREAQRALALAEADAYTTLICHGRELLSKITREAGKLSEAREHLLRLIETARGAGYASIAERAEARLLELDA